MKRGSKIKLSLLVVLLCISFVLLLCELVFSNNRIKTYEISVIAPGKSDESMMLLKEGTEQAASELNANIRFIFLSQEQNPKEQIELMKRESKNNVDAIIISPIDCQEVAEAIEEVKKTVPVIVIQSSLKTTSSVDRITNDDYLLGQQLASTMLENSDNKRVAIVNSSLESTAIEERYEGSTKELGDNNREYYRYVLSNDDKNSSYADIEEIIIKENIGSVICLDTKASEYIGEFKRSLSKELSGYLKVYGVGSTNKVISLLEEDIINGTVTQNEFNIGYLAVENAISNKKKNKAIDLKVKANIVTSENMYLDENERILFQFVR